MTVRVFTWEMYSISAKMRVDYLLVGRELFISAYNMAGHQVTNDTYADVETAYRRAVAMTEKHENDGYVLRGGIWTCEMEVPIAEIQKLIHLRNHWAAAQKLDSIIKAARIVGALEL